MEVRFHAPDAHFFVSRRSPARLLAATSQYPARLRVVASIGRAAIAERTQTGYHHSLEAISCSVSLQIVDGKAHLSAVHYDTYGMPVPNAVPPAIRFAVNGDAVHLRLRLLASGFVRLYAPFACREGDYVYGVDGAPEARIDGVECDRAPGVYRSPFVMPLFERLPLLNLDAAPKTLRYKLVDARIPRPAATYADVDEFAATECAVDAAGFSSHIRSGVCEVTANPATIGTGGATVFRIGAQHHPRAYETMALVLRNFRVVADDEELNAIHRGRAQCAPTFQRTEIRLFASLGALGELDVTPAFGTDDFSLSGDNAASIRKLGAKLFVTGEKRGAVVVTHEASRSNASIRVHEAPVAAARMINRVHTEFALAMSPLQDTIGLEAGGTLFQDLRGDKVGYLLSAVEWEDGTVQHLFKEEVRVDSTDEGLRWALTDAHHTVRLTPQAETKCTEKAASIRFSACGETIVEGGVPLLIRGETGPTAGRRDIVAQWWFWTVLVLSAVTSCMLCLFLRMSSHRLRRKKIDPVTPRTPTGVRLVGVGSCDYMKNSNQLRASLYRWAVHTGMLARSLWVLCSRKATALLASFRRSS